MSNTNITSCEKRFYNEPKYSNIIPIKSTKPLENESKFIIPMRIAKLPNITKAYMLIYETIFQFWNKGQECYLSTEAIVKRTGHSKRQIYKALNYLEQNNELKRVEKNNRRYFEQPKDKTKNAFACNTPTKLNKNYEEEYYIIPRYITQIPKITKVCMNLYAQANQFWNKGQECYLTTNEISKRTDNHKRNIKQALKFLEDHNEIKREIINNKRYLNQSKKVIHKGDHHSTQGGIKRALKGGSKEHTEVKNLNKENKTTMIEPENKATEKKTIEKLTEFGLTKTKALEVLKLKLPTDNRSDIEFTNHVINHLNDNPNNYQINQRIGGIMAILKNQQTPFKYNTTKQSKTKENIINKTNNEQQMKKQDNDNMKTLNYYQKITNDRKTKENELKIQPKS